MSFRCFFARAHSAPGSERTAARKQRTWHSLERSGKRCSEGREWRGAAALRAGRLRRAALGREGRGRGATSHAPNGARLPEGGLASAGVGAAMGGRGALGLALVAAVAVTLVVMLQPVLTSAQPARAPLPAPMTATSTQPNVQSGGELSDETLALPGGPPSGPASSAPSGVFVGSGGGGASGGAANENSSVPSPDGTLGESSDAKGGGGLSTGVIVAICVAAAVALVAGVTISLRISRRSARGGLEALQRVSSVGTSLGSGSQRSTADGGSDSGNGSLPSSTRSLGSDRSLRMASVPNGRLPRLSEEPSTPTPSLHHARSRSHDDLAPRTSRRARTTGHVARQERPGEHMISPLRAAAATNARDFSAGRMLGSSSGNRPSAPGGGQTAPSRDASEIEMPQIASAEDIFSPPRRSSRRPDWA